MQPTIRGLRYPVENLVELLASGMTIDEIIEDHDDLQRDDLLAALEFAALAIGIRRVVPLGAVRNDRRTAGLGARRPDKTLPTGTSGRVVWRASCPHNGS